MTSPIRSLGLALSGGGSRAAAFHRGTLQALLDLNLVERIDVVSTVSGGSLFGGAWMAARLSGMSDSAFLANMHDELKRGFVLRSVRPRLLKTIIPGLRYSRTDVIAGTFDKCFFQGRLLSDLPARPELCINTTILNNGQVGKFTRRGFSAAGLYCVGSTPRHQSPMPGFPLARAVAASAAFPIGLPPLQLSRKDFPKSIEFRDSLAGARTITLTDGGVLENLGIQTLLKSKRFGTWDMVVSDAGTAAAPWRAGALMNPVRSFGVWLLSGRILDQVMIVMNDKENRWAREQVVQQVQFSWTIDGLRTGRGSLALADFVAAQPSLSRRNVLFVRVAQDWRRFLLSIPLYRLQELAPGQSLPNNAAGVEQRLDSAGIDLTAARQYYSQLGGDDGAQAVNGVATNFTGLNATILDQLAAHAAWQIHATHAVYGL